ncbi:UDP-glucuronosyl/UDP-glucosyltransferase [Parasponia andersonii]|uniref:UDP-glucuronosyl/UDP-glucosyltransferase n=1 Tax=Parasponia andersonii TaxID=3476 RepID=A0A2P5AQE3_PARAD|nr:UDP-glucuronosyl/UDP-glucosyltransferase [Parasponia andersonii]
MKALELVFIPTPGRGHQVSMVKFSKLLVTRDDRFLITVLITRFPFDNKLDAYTDSLAASTASDRIKFVDLSKDDIGIYETNPLIFMDLFSEYYKSHFKKIAIDLAHKSSTLSPDSPRLAGFVVDMLMTTMIDVANELKVSLGNRRFLRLDRLRKKLERILVKEKNLYYHLNYFSFA